MTQDTRPTAIVLTNGLFARADAKTTHGLVRGPSRYRIVAVIDATLAGQDAGELLDGTARGIPIHANVTDALGLAPQFAIIGVATKGGVLPDSLRHDVLVAADSGLSLVNGLHSPLSEDTEIARRAAAAGGAIIDLRRAPTLEQLRFWTGDVLQLDTPRVPVLGTDCALGKRTTCGLMQASFRQQGIAASVVYTGQTGWLQGYEHGFIFDATPNDFVPGQLEGAVLKCASADAPQLILIEGQASLRNPSGPCGSEMIVSMGAAGVILMHAAGRKHFKGFADRGLVIPPLEEEIALINALGSPVWAIGLHEEDIEDAAATEWCRKTEDRIGIPCLRPLAGGADALANVVGRNCRLEPR